MIDSAIVNKRRYNNILSCVAAFANESYQKYAWAGNDPKIADWYDERICMFFDDYAIENFIECPPPIGLKSENIQALKIFTERLKHFDDHQERGLQVDDLYKMPEWLEIVALAHATLLQLPKIPAEQRGQ